MILDPEEAPRGETEAKTGDVVLFAPDALGREGRAKAPRVDRWRRPFLAALSLAALGALTSGAATLGAPEEASVTLIEARLPTLAPRAGRAEPPPAEGRAGPRDPGQKRRRR